MVFMAIHALGKIRQFREDWVRAKGVRNATKAMDNMWDIYGLWNIYGKIYGTYTAIWGFP